MLVLGIESATSVASVALCEGNKLLLEKFVNHDRTHSIYLLPMIKDILEEAKVDGSLLTGIAVSDGPGSFTGIRIGMSVAKTLAQVWNIPIVGVSTLDSLAYSLLGAGEGYVCSLLIAKKDEVYTSLYDTSNGSLKKLWGALAISPQALVEKLALKGKRIVFVGDGVSTYKDFLTSSLKEVCFASDLALIPRGAGIALLGQQKLAEGKGENPLFLMPNYARLCEAEVKWLEKQKNKAEEKCN